jgi:VanZ family protein
MRLAAIVWLLGWAVFGLPLEGVRSRPRLNHVQVVPFEQPGPRDTVRNLVYYIPMGLIGAALGWRSSAVVGAAALLSGGTEVAQLFAVGERYPSTTDVVLNVGGAIVGIAIADALRRLWRASQARAPERA